MESAMKGTTVVAVKFEEGVVVAADRQVTMMHSLNADFSCDKILPLGRDAVVGFAGPYGIVLPVVETAKRVLKSEERTLRKSVSFMGRLQILRRVVVAVLKEFGQAPSGYIFAGFDMRRGTARIFYVESSGVPLETDFYCSIGSGMDRANSFFDEEYAPPTGAFLRQDEAVALAERALAHTAKRNIATGSPDEGMNMFVVTRGKIEDRSRVSGRPTGPNRRGGK